VRERQQSTSKRKSGATIDPSVAQGSISLCRFQRQHRAPAASPPPLSLSNAAPEFVHYGRPIFKAAPKKLCDDLPVPARIARAVVSEHEQFDPNIPNGPVAAGSGAKVHLKRHLGGKVLPSLAAAQMRFYNILTALNLVIVYFQLSTSVH